MKWKIKYPNESVYVSTNVSLVMKNCQLKNSRKIAEKIYSGKSKEVCAWVNCEDVKIVNESQLKSKNSKKISYNPRKRPFWFSEKEENLDGHFFESLVSVDKQLYAK